MREWLDPSNNTGAQLPDEGELLAELAAPKWRLRGPIIEVESRDQIVERIGRSPDRASRLHPRADRDAPQDRARIVDAALAGAVALPAAAPRPVLRHRPQPRREAPQRDLRQHRHRALRVLAAG
jgi:hypothetical protein